MEAYNTTSSDASPTAQPAPAPASPRFWPMCPPELLGDARLTPLGRLVVLELLRRGSWLADGEGDILLVRGPLTRSMARALAVDPRSIRRILADLRQTCRPDGHAYLWRQERPPDGHSFTLALPYPANPRRRASYSPAPAPAESQATPARGRRKRAPTWKERQAPAASTLIGRTLLYSGSGQGPAPLKPKAATTGCASAAAIPAPDPILTRGHAVQIPPDLPAWARDLIRRAAPAQLVASQIAAAGLEQKKSCLALLESAGYSQARTIEGRRVALLGVIRQMLPAPAPAPAEWEGEPPTQIPRMYADPEPDGPGKGPLPATRWLSEVLDQVLGPVKRE